MLIFLATLISAGSVTTSLFYDSTTSNSLQIIQGQNAGVIVSANSIFESSMRLRLNLLDSSGNLVNNILDIQTINDSYSNYLTLGPSAYINTGNYTLVSIVTGASGQTDSDTLFLEVLPQTSGNNLPIITSVPVTEVNETQFFSYQVTVTDADNDILTYFLVQAPTWISMNNYGLITGTAPNVFSDYSYLITVEVSDGKDFVRQTFSIIVRDTNQAGDTTPPFITVISPLNNQVYTTSNVLFEISTNENVSSAWYVLNSGNNVPMTQISGTSFRNTVSLANGIYNVVFYARDLAGNIGQSQSVVFNVNLSGNNPPIITSTPVTSVNESTAYSYQVTATDADGNVLTYSLTTAPTWLSINSATGLVSGTAPAVTADTNFPITISASDGISTTTQNYVLTVKDIPGMNNPPVITSAPVISINEGVNYVYQVTATDVDGNTLSYSFSGPSWLSINSQTGRITGIAPLVSADTNFSVTIVASDGTTNATQIYVLTVNDVSGGGGGSGSRATSGGASTGFASDLSFENQNYLNQFAPKTAAEEQAPAAEKSKNLFTILLVVSTLLLVAILLVSVVFLAKKIASN